MFYPISEYQRESASTSLYFFGAGACAAGAGAGAGAAAFCAGCALASAPAGTSASRLTGSAGATGAAFIGFTPFISELALGFEDTYASAREVIMKTMAAPVVIFVKNGAGPAPPKTVCEAPPNAAPISAPFPVWSSTIKISAMHTKTWMITNNTYICFVPEKIKSLKVNHRVYRYLCGG